MSLISQLGRYELYVGTFESHLWTTKSLCDYFYQLIEEIKIIDCRFYSCGDEKSQNYCFAILMLDSLSSVDQCLAKHKQIRKEHHLTVQRLLNVSSDQKPICEHILIHIQQYDQSFTIENVLNYFGQYGSIIQWKNVDDRRTFLLNFEDYDSVDRIFLDQPHLLNHQSILIRKCYNPCNITMTSSIENFLKRRIVNLQAGVDRSTYLHESELRKLEKQIRENIAMEEDRLADIIRSYIRLERIQRDLKQDLTVTRQINQKLKEQLQKTVQNNQRVVDHYENQLEQQRLINKSFV